MRNIFKMAKIVFTKLQNLLISKKEKIKYILKLAYIVLIYGLIINYILHQLLSSQFTLAKVIAYGFIAYIIKVEIPFVITSCYPRR